MKANKREQDRQRRHQRVRLRVYGTITRPRLNVSTTLTPSPKRRQHSGCSLEDAHELLRPVGKGVLGQKAPARPS